MKSKPLSPPASPQNPGTLSESETEAKTERRVFSAQQKCQAVLSMWSGMRTSTEICEELQIQWAVLNNWQERALSAMLEVLGPRRRPEEERGPSLPQRLQDLLERRTNRDAVSRLQSRLTSAAEKG